MRLLTATALATLALAVPSAAGHSTFDAKSCGAGEPAFNGWNYYDLQAYGVKCPNAHNTAEEYVYDFSTEGVIEPPRHWDECKDKKVGPGVWKGKCKRDKDGRKQKLTFTFGGP